MYSARGRTPPADCDAAGADPPDADGLEIEPVQLRKAMSTVKLAFKSQAQLALVFELHAKVRSQLGTPLGTQRHPCASPMAAH